MTNEKHWYKLGLALTALTVLELSTSNSAEAATFTVGGFTWNQANSVSTAEIVQGSIEEAAFITPFGQGLTEFDPSQSVGQLLGYNPNPAYSSSVPFPESNGNLIVPNQDRATIKLTWDNRLLPNLAGDDFVIYESGNSDAPEGFSVSVLKYGVYVVGLHNVEPIPEPLTILGSATALGIGGLLKREHSRKQKQSE